MRKTNVSTNLKINKSTNKFWLKNNWRKGRRIRRRRKERRRRGRRNGINLKLIHLCMCLGCLLMLLKMNLRNLLLRLGCSELILRLVRRKLKSTRINMGYPKEMLLSPMRGIKVLILHFKCSIWTKLDLGSRLKSKKPSSTRKIKSTRKGKAKKITKSRKFWRRKMKRNNLLGMMISNKKVMGLE